MGDKISPTTLSQSSVPIKLGGMTIPKHNEGTGMSHQTSVYQHNHLIDYLKCRSEFDRTYHGQIVILVRLESKGMKKSKDDATLRGVPSDLAKSEVKKLD